MVIYNIYIFKSVLGPPLVVQWLRLCTPNAGGIGLILGRELRSLNATQHASPIRMLKLKKFKFPTPLGNHI